jgi:hypothetical protein
MSTTARIFQAINRLALGQLLTTRDLLGMGTRAAIDQSVYRLVKSGFIVRVARGVFMRRNSPQPSAWQVACAKAKAFCKEIYQHGADVAKELGFANEGNQSPAFACSGRSTSFRFGEQVIRLVGMSPRKLHQGDNLSGQVIRALWHLGKAQCTTGLIALTYPRWSEAVAEIHASAKALPHWMNNLFYWAKQDSGHSRNGATLLPTSVDLGEIFPEFKHVFRKYDTPDS